MNNNSNNVARQITVSTKYGNKSIMTTLDGKQAVQVIQADKNASGFALDLVSKGAKWGLSPKQLDWMIYLAQESLDKANKPVNGTPVNGTPVNGTPVNGTPAVPVLSNVASLFTLFGKANLNLKYPRLRLTDASGRMVVIKISGSGSKHCGSLNITNGAKYGDSNNVFYGYVHQDGSCTIKDVAVLDLLKSLGNDPAGVAASQGLASGSCVCCGRALSDSEAGSSEIGYGPVCAGNWGLPWQANGKAEAVAVPIVAKKTRKPRKTKSIVALVAGSEVSQSVAELADAYLAELNA